MNILNKILEEINDLKDGASEKEEGALQELGSQAHQAAHAEWTYEELSTYLKSEHDVLDGFDPDSEFFAKIREIQDGIINDFGNEFQS